MPRRFAAVSASRAFGARPPTGRSSNRRQGGLSGPQAARASRSPSLLLACSASGGSERAGWAQCFHTGTWIDAHDHDCGAHTQSHAHDWSYPLPACHVRRWTNALLGASQGSSNLSVVAALKPFPNIRSSEELLRLEGKQDAASQESFGLLVDAAVPLALTFALPLLVSTVTLEKEHKLRSLMVMMGLRMRWYWLCEWMANMFIQLLVSLVLFAAGTAVGLPFIIQSTSVWILLTLEWIQVMPAMAMLLSAFYSKLLVSSVVTQLLVIILVAVSLILNRFTYNGPGDTFPSSLFLIAPLAYYRAIHLMLRRPYLLTTLAGEMRTIVIMLAIDAGLYATLATYFDAVLPREFGVVQHPLFFLQPCQDALFRRRPGRAFPLWNSRVRDNSKREGGDGRSTNKATVIRNRSADDGGINKAAGASTSVEEKEDEDVAIERAAVEAAVSERLNGGLGSSSLSAKWPIELYSLSKIYPGGKAAVDRLTLAVRENECFGLLGPNGAGKTSTIAILTGLYPPTSGRAIICGAVPHRPKRALYKPAASPPERLCMTLAHVRTCDRLRPPPAHAPHPRADGSLPPV